MIIEYKIIRVERDHIQQCLGLTPGLGSLLAVRGEVGASVDLAKPGGV